MLDGRALSRGEAIGLLSLTGEAAENLWSAAATLRDRGKGRVVSYSRKVFIPLTNLCRDSCSYCTFRKDPWEPGARIMTPAEVLAVTEAGKAFHCTEALFTLGERPEQRYPEARDTLHTLGYSSTLEYLRDVSELVIQETGLLPHANPGTMTRKEMVSLRDVNASMGLMLENVSERLCEEGGPHHDAPSKHPKVRLATIRNAGELKIAFTTGLLIGIGETAEEIIDSLYAIRELDERYHHIQEVIIQNFRAKPGTPMASHPEPSHEFMLNSVAVARLVLGKGMNIQVPPNLSPDSYAEFLFCGINDWGGISPVTKDFVNPEAPWPEVARVSNDCEKHGFKLRARLPVYPEFVLRKKEFLPEKIANVAASVADSEGYVSGGGSYN
ncbi:MAG: 7,8-didemethyl-8-hydroxy-5-deazariboflavin synthase CofG [Nitrososphaerota archaeon]|nr:7,8-didemethyl-8-hydroxy-5-deazariboflavin synthase CofG [Nitrososphaerota archaeon]